MGRALVGNSLVCGLFARMSSATRKFSGRTFGWRFTGSGSRILPARDSGLRHVECHPGGPFRIGHPWAIGAG